jgi:hypothetical protein
MNKQVTANKQIPQAVSTCIQNNKQASRETNT